MSLLKPYRTEIKQAIAEESTRTFAFDCVDDKERPLPGSQISSMLLTVWNESDSAGTRLVTDRDIRNQNGGFVDEEGSGTLTLFGADNRILNASAKQEKHVALVKWTFLSGTKTGKAEIAFPVDNLRWVP